MPCKKILNSLLSLTNFRLLTQASVCINVLVSEFSSEFITKKKKKEIVYMFSSDYKEVHISNFQEHSDVRVCSSVAQNSFSNCLNVLYYMWQICICFLLKSTLRHFFLALTGLWCYTKICNPEKWRNEESSGRIWKQCFGVSQEKSHETAIWWRKGMSSAGAYFDLV